MPSTQPAKLNAKDLSELMRQLNFMIKDIYANIDKAMGIDNKTFEPESLGPHDHTTDTTGGDYAFADFLAQDVVYLQALRTRILQSNLLDKTANESITGTWDFTPENVSQFMPGVSTITGNYTADDEDLLMIVNASLGAYSGSFSPQASSDDGYATSGVYNNNGNDLNFGKYLGNSARTYAKLTNTIPSEAIITSAIIEYVGYLGASSPSHATIHFNDVDSVGSPPANGAAVFALALTSGTAWNNIETNILGNVYYSPDCKSDLQEVIDRVGRGNSDPIMLVIDDNASTWARGCCSYDHPTYNPIKLNVGWNTSVPTITLPTAVGRQGKLYVVKKSDSSAWQVDIVTNGAETIDGDASLTLYKQNDSVLLVSDNTNWKIVADYRIQKQSHIADATATHTITDPADTPADADALRDDLVANAIPELTTGLDNLGTKINAILSALESAGILETS